ncbi:MAG: hypothetical protein QNK03_05530 [Myxococcota bacterium]|nr:hypothetical protein [Myxococcota bacterium]
MLRRIWRLLSGSDWRGRRALPPGADAVAARTAHAALHESLHWARRLDAAAPEGSAQARRATDAAVERIEASQRRVAQRIGAPRAVARAELAGALVTIAHRAERRARRERDHSRA